MSTYKITKIDKELGHVSVIYSVDGIEQKMGDCPLDTEENTKAFLEEYGNRYEKTLAENAVVTDPKVDALVGKTFTVPEVIELSLPIDPVI